MPRRKLKEKNIRKITTSGRSYAVTLPKEIMTKLGWKKKQKVVIKQKGESIIITDWK